MISNNVKIFKVGKVVLERMANKENLVTVSDQLSATFLDS